MDFSVKTEGLSELVSGFRDLTKATGKNVLKRTLKKSVEPTRESAQSLAPVADEPYFVGTKKKKNRRLMQPGRIKRSVDIATQLTRRSKAFDRKVGADKHSAEVYVGPTAGEGALSNATRKEFGNSNTLPEPFMRPAWEGTKFQVLENIRKNLAVELEKARGRAARKAARLAKGK